MKTRSSSRGRGESCSLKSTNESRGCASDISQSAQHDNTNSNRSFIELTKNSRKRRHSDVTYSSKEDQLTNVLNKTVSVVLEPFDMEKRRKNESRGCASDISQSAQHDNTNSNRSFIELTKNSRKRRHSAVTCSSKKAATNYQEESEHDQLASVLNKTVSVVLEPLDVEKRIQAKVANRNKKKCISNYSVRDVKITTKSSNGCSTENQERSTTGSMDSRSSERCLQKSTHHDGKELHNSDQKNVASLSLSHDDDQGLLESSTHQSRRQLWDASHKMSSEFRRERRKIYKKPVCTCCVGKDNNSGNEIRVASDGLKAKHNKHMEKSIRNSDVNRAASRTQKRKTVVGASHSKVKDADYQYGGRPLTTEHSSTSSETITTLKMTSEVFKDGQSSRNREINSHSSRSVTPTSCSVATAPLQMTHSATSQPAHALTHLEMHPYLRRRSASAPPQLQLGDTFRKTVDVFARLLQDVAAHLQKCANRVGDTLSDRNFEHTVAGVSHLVSSCTCHSPIGCLLYSINIMNALKSRLSAELNVVSLSNGDAVQPAAAGTQSNGNLMGRFHLEASIKEKTNTEASVEGGGISESAPQCDTTTLTTKSRNILSPAETCISTSHSTSLTEETNDTPSPVGSTDNAHIEASIRETAQLEANTKESTSTITCITEDNVSKSASEYGATSSSVEPIIMVSAAGTFTSTSSSPTGGPKEILDLHEVDTVVSDQNNVNGRVDDRTGCASSKSNLMCGSAEQVQDGERNTFDSVSLSMEEIEIKEEVETSESDSELELSEKQYSQNEAESDAGSCGPEGDETDRDENMVEVECNIVEASDLSNHTGNESHMKDLRMEAQHEYDNNSTENDVAEDATSNGVNTALAVNRGDDTDAVNNTGYSVSGDDDGDVDYGGNRNEDVEDTIDERYGGHINEDNVGDATAEQVVAQGNDDSVEDTDTEVIGGHSTEGSVQDTSASRCGDGHGTEDGTGDANAAGDDGNRKEDNVGDATAEQVDAQGNDDGVEDTDTEVIGGHSTEGSVQDTSASRCGDGHGTEDGTGDANAAGDDGNRKEDNVGDATAEQVDAQGNDDGVEDTDTEVIGGHSTEGSVQDTSASKCGDGRGTEDGTGDANAAGDDGNRKEDNVGDASEPELIDGSQYNNPWEFVEQPYGGGYAGPYYEELYDPDVVAVHALVSTVRHWNGLPDGHLYKQMEIRVYGGGVWRVYQIPNRQCY
ncbi:serine-rich adhesin for platelets-like [Schistocerca cancellata]|uniref:serine-rich adhesin for platelets-like n=1 Tax=Schistocerca cancellata TaxID=274614 RepID=UPI002117F25D|nr:serine-rich adhesin for platelets-like [Schistocerca cancellata]XP_049781878.1 serine-rich adhesin for platelets-like [Schistocerca cancellata]XP_049781879.1 serine-rich adhesin for platelets-like [Schistocerca cancellata]XP_049781880.1 serine-rich adhesin for platelets-like [Schistocerca cancellata]XP_049781881.1 serine-rich adhesin for platelets-like [Schistocerca cancellata]XP_049781883.1 serine-rich adhesin for platelets-like [Schistocerca cancellata]